MFLQKYKIVIGGTLAAGKIDAIQSLSKSSVLSMDALNIDDDSQITGHHLNQVLVHYSEIELDDGVLVGLYATPTDDFDSIEEKLYIDAIGTIILIDHSQKSSVEALEIYVNACKHHLDNIIIGVTHTDQDSQQLLKKYRNWIKMHNQSIPLFAVDVQRKDDVLMMIQTLIARNAVI